MNEVKKELRKEQIDLVLRINCSTQTAKLSAQENFQKVKTDIRLLAEHILQELLADPAKEHLLIRK